MKVEKRFINGRRGERNNVSDSSDLLEKGERVKEQKVTIKGAPIVYFERTVEELIRAVVESTCPAPSMYKWTRDAVQVVELITIILNLYDSALRSCSEHFRIEAITRLKEKLDKLHPDNDLIF